MDYNCQDEYKQRALFNDELIQGESIEWSGQPDPNVLFTKADIFLVPVTLIWSGGIVSSIFGSSGIFRDFERDSGLGFIPQFAIWAAICSNGPLRNIRAVYI